LDAPSPVEISTWIWFTPDPPTSSIAEPVIMTVLLETAALGVGQVMVTVGEASSMVKFMTSVPKIDGVSMLPVPVPSAAKELSSARASILIKKLEVLGPGQLLLMGMA